LAPILNFYEIFTGNSFEHEEHLKTLLGRNKKIVRMPRPEKLSDRRCEKQIGGVPRTRALRSRAVKIARYDPSQMIKHA
jgi:hypothetical protein